MEQYIIKGGNPLNGEVVIGGAKNAALGILAAAIMADETVTIENMPNVRDTNVLLQAIQGIGAKFIEYHQGEYDNIVGLSMKLVINNIEKINKTIED